MLCNEFRDLMFERLSGELTPQQDAACSQHEQSCVICRAELAQFRDVQTKLRAGWPSEEPLPIRVVLPQMAGAKSKEAAEALIAGAEPGKQQVALNAEKSGKLAGAGKGVKIPPRDNQHGSLKWIVEDDGAIRSAIGAVFQDNLLDNLLTVEENLKTRGSFYGLRGRALHDAILRAAKVTGITDILKRPYGKLSGGQRRRCDISRALVHMPKILFLDEPTTGLDPQTRKNVWETITALQKETGMTVFMTTHYMEEAAGADYVIIIDDGLVVAKGTPSELKERYTSDKLSLVSKNTDDLCSRLDAMNLKYKVIADQVIVQIPSTLAALPIVNDCAALISGFEVTKGTMDDAFIAITGKEIRE
jgi:multidrug/hemolysin transport system ATP-binding protein